MDLAEVRTREFPALRDKAFLDAACVSLAPSRAVAAVKAFADAAADCVEEDSSAHHVAMDGMRAKAYAEGARLLHAAEEEIALVESTTYGLNVAALSLPLPAGSRVLTTSLEFLQVAMPWAMAKDCEVVVVPGRDGRFALEDFEALADARTRMIVVSSVEWCNGWRIDVKELGRFCHERGIHFVVDGIQHVGALDFDVRDAHIDMMTAGGHKWLNAPFGCGLLYVNRELLGKLDPPLWGYLNLVTPPQGWPGYFGTPSIQPVDDWHFVQTARRLEVGGTSNYPGAVALGESLALVNEIGIENVERHNLELASYCAEVLGDAGAHVVTHAEAPEGNRSAIVVFRFYQDMAEEQRLMREIHRQGVYVAMRFTSRIGGLRVSCHYFNTHEDVDRLAAVLRQEGARKAPDYQSGVIA
jgi:selenocysteine lyase/cysteine desulfurase